MNTLWQDMRYGFRVLMKKPGFTLVAVLALTLGIGANTAIFSVVNTVLLRPLPYRDAGQLVMVWEYVPRYGFPRNTPAPANFADWREQNTVFEGMAALADESFNLTGGGDPERVEGQRVTAGLFSLLGVETALGRTFSPEEDAPGAGRVAVISHGLWQRRFGAEPSIIGRAITLDDESYTVVGVMPPSFQFLGRENQLWVPMAFSPSQAANRQSHFLQVVARMKPGVTRDQAQAEMATIAARLEQQYPQSNTGVGANVVALHEQLVGDVRPALLVILGAVGFILLIACANVANLLLARGAARKKEFAVRAALGAGRVRLIRQLLTESVLLAALGGAAGLLLAAWATEFLLALVPQDISPSQVVGVDARVLGFTFLISLVTGLTFGLAPALLMTRPDLNEALKEGSRGGEGFQRSRVRRALIVSEVALAFVLLTGAGLMLKSFWLLRQTEPGFDARNLLTMRAELPRSRYGKPEQRAAFYEQVLERTGGLAGVESAAVISFLPMTFEGGSNTFTFENHPPLPAGQEPLALIRAASPGYFRTMRIPLLAGRDFGAQDSADAPPVAVINQAMVRKYWPGEDAMGKRLKMGQANSDYPWVTVVGVTGDVRQMELSAEPKPEVYFPYRQFPESWLAPRDLVVRTATDPLGLTAAVRGEVWAVDKALPVSNVQTMEQITAASVARQRFQMLLLGLFAALALVLAGVGIYGVMSYTVAQRTHEIGVRMALGAQTRDVLRLILGQGMALAVAGVAIGLVAAFAITRLMTSLLFGVTATDPLTFAGVALVLSSVALLACLIPARRAIRVDPMEALRFE